MEGKTAGRFVSERCACRINSFPETPPEYRFGESVPQRKECNRKARKNVASCGLDQILPMRWRVPVVRLARSWVFDSVIIPGSSLLVWIQRVIELVYAIYCQCRFISQGLWPVPVIPGNTHYLQSLFAGYRLCQLASGLGLCSVIVGANFESAP